MEAAKPPPQLHHSHDLQPKQETKSPIRKSPTKMRSPSPRRPADKRAKFADEVGGQLETTISPSPQRKQTGMRLGQARKEVSRKEGESRSEWKDRVFKHLRQQPGGVPRREVTTRKGR